MKKHLLAIFFAFTAMFMLNGCIVSETKLTDKVREAIVSDEASKGNTLEVTEFGLNKNEKNYTGVLKGRLNGKEVVYDVTAIDEGDDFDVDWEIRPDSLSNDQP